MCSHYFILINKDVFNRSKGGVDLITRIPWGIVADHKSVNRHYLMSFVCLNMAVAIYCFTLSNTYIHLIGIDLNPKLGIPYAVFSMVGTPYGMDHITCLMRFVG